MSNISPEANMVLTIASNMIKRGENPPINMTTVLVMELERIKLWRISNMATTSHTDVDELVRAARVEEKRIIYLALAKLTLDSKDSYYLGRDLLNYMKKHGYELATAQPPHKAEQ